MIRVLTCSVFLTLSITAQASVSSDLTNFFNKTGYASNVTSPMAFESQASGYFGGGSLFVRSQVREYRLVHLSMPTYRAGCGGIDLFTGSFSFLSHEKLVDLESTIKGFDAICKGEYDHLPEAAFYMVGTIEEAVEKAEKMAKDAAA